MKIQSFYESIKNKKPRIDNNRSGVPDFPADSSSAVPDPRSSAVISSGRSSDFPTLTAAFPLRLGTTVALPADRVFSSRRKRDYSGGSVPDLHEVPFSSVPAEPEKLCNFVKYNFVEYNILLSTIKWRPSQLLCFRKTGSNQAGKIDRPAGSRYKLSKDKFDGVAKSPKLAVLYVVTY